MSSIVISPGQKLAFLGASITQFGWEQPGGYVRLIVECLAQNGVPVTPIPAGISGNTSRDMRNRLERDVLSQKPDGMILDSGRNDVWHGTVEFDEYMDNLAFIVDTAQAAGVRVILQTITPIDEDLNNDFNRKLAYFNDFVRYLAGQKKCLLSELNGAFQEALRAKTGPGSLLTVDGVHMNDRGNRLMATGLLQTLGLTDEQIAKTIHETK